MRDRQDLERLRKQIDRAVRILPLGKAPKTLYDPARYFLGLGGKRLRPALVLLAYRLYKRNVQPIMPYAAAVEVFHNFTLMHDDIMDHAPVRRGKATVHEKWDLSTAVLSGDVMLVRVYAIFNALPGAVSKKVIEAFNRCATGVCEGQRLDMDFEKRARVSEKEYIEMIRLKTAVLLGFSLELGGLLAGARPRECRALRNVGMNLGMGFQLMDDVLDVYGKPRAFGKQHGGDIASNKKTYLLIAALDHATPGQRSTLKKWMLRKGAGKVSAVKKIYDDLNVRGLALKKAARYMHSGLRQLEALQGDRRSLKMLRDLAVSLAGREV